MSPTQEQVNQMNQDIEAAFEKALTTSTGVVDATIQTRLAVLERANVGQKVLLEALPEKLQVKPGDIILFRVDDPYDVNGDILAMLKAAFQRAAGGEVLLIVLPKQDQMEVTVIGAADRARLIAAIQKLPVME